MAYSKEDFHIGQRVRVRQVNDMVCEFGYMDESNCFINCPDGPGFNIECMGTMCGMTAEITGFKLIIEDDEDGWMWMVLLDNWVDLSGNRTDERKDWFWTPCMLEPLDVREYRNKK